jgi:putative Holliday junction resolvase
MKSGRRIAFDYGQVRIGVAISDVSGLIASPLTTLKREDPTLDNQIRSLVEEYEPIYLVVGEPRHLSGTQSSTMLAVKEFGDFLESVSSLPVHYVDERMSTVSAARRLRDSGKNAKESKEFIDAMAAVTILESALARERIAGGLD